MALKSSDDPRSCKFTTQPLPSHGNSHPLQTPPPPKEPDEMGAPPPPRMVTCELSRVCCWLRQRQQQISTCRPQEEEKSLSRAENGPRRLSQKVCESCGESRPFAVGRRQHQCQLQLLHAQQSIQTWFSLEPPLPFTPHRKVGGLLSSVTPPPLYNQMAEALVRGPFLHPLPLGGSCDEDPRRADGGGCMGGGGGLEVPQHIWLKMIPTMR